MSGVLVVDDHPTDRRLLAGILEREGFAVFEAATGAEALQLAETCQPDLILLDISLPDRDGYDVCSTLRASLATSTIPVIFVSATEAREDIATGLELGGADFIHKPYWRREVLARIRTHLQIGQLNTSLQSVNDDLLRLSNDLLDKQKRLEEDLKAAAQIQQALLPSGEVRPEGVDVAWTFLPCEDVGGDIFNLLQLDERHWGLYIVDVTGHGVPSAMVTVSVAQSLAPHLGITVAPGAAGAEASVASPATVLTQLDQEYPLERFDRTFTICYAVFDSLTGELAYASAAHPPPLLMRAGGSVERLEEGGPVIGLGAFLAFEEGRTRLAAGDRVFFYTDGIVEHCSPSGELFGEDRLVALLRRGAGSGLEELCQKVMHELTIFGNRRPPRDDISLLALEYRGGSA